MAAGPGQRRRQGTNDVVVARQIEAVIDLKHLGLTVRQIAAELGMTPSTVHNRIHQGLAMIVAPTVERFRVESDAQLVDMERRLLADAYELTGPTAFRDRVAAVEAVRRIEDQRAKLHGAYAPVEVEVTQVVDPFARLAELEADLAVNDPAVVDTGAAL